MFRKKLLSKKNRGSALVVALFILSIILISALSITLVAVKERLASVGSAGSNKAYQTADIGIEKVMQLLTRGNYDYINNGINSLYGNLPSGMSCNSSSGLLESADYSVELFDNSDLRINCDDSSALVSDIARIKSIGTVSNSSRAVEALVLNKITKLLMHFNDNFLDYSFFRDAYTIEKNGAELGFIDTDPTAVDETKYTKFILSGAYFEVKDNDSADGIDFNLLDKDFTIEAWIKPETLPSGSDINFTITSQWDGNDKQFRFYYMGRDSISNKGLAFEYFPDGGSTPITKISDIGIDLTDGDWHHVAVARKNNELYFFIDGEKKGMENINEKINGRSNKNIYIGASLDGNSPSAIDSNYQFYGGMDELRITKGVARWTDDFELWDIEYAPNN